MRCALSSEFFHLPIPLLVTHRLLCPIPGSRQDALGSRQDALGSRQDALGSRQDALGSLEAVPQSDAIELVDGSV
jgi:hypothetical protein